MKCYERGIQLDDQNADLWYSKGNALLKLKWYSDALAAYDEATDLKPEYKKAWAAKCVILNAMKLTNQARIACSNS